MFDPPDERTPLDARRRVRRCSPRSRCSSSSRSASPCGRDRDPLGLPGRRRTAYVYLAEVLVVLFFTQIRFNVPELFLGGAREVLDVRRSWRWRSSASGWRSCSSGGGSTCWRSRCGGPACCCRWCRCWRSGRSRRRSLCEFADEQAPGLRPLLGYLEKLPQHFDTYAVAVVPRRRRCTGCSRCRGGRSAGRCSAALATNAALWALLAHHEVPFAVHPQAWVIPLALIVLVSEHVNRRQLRPEASDGLRYLGHRDDLRRVGGGHVHRRASGSRCGCRWCWRCCASPGVLAGILLRVRAFLFLGVGFLLLDVFAMIWHAAVDLRQTWVWYASGIVLGVRSWRCSPCSRSGSGTPGKRGAGPERRGRETGRGSKTPHPRPSAATSPRCRGAR